MRERANFSRVASRAYTLGYLESTSTPRLSRRSTERCSAALAVSPVEFRALLRTVKIFELRSRLPLRHRQFTSHVGACSSTLSSKTRCINRLFFRWLFVIPREIRKHRIVKIAEGISVESGYAIRACAPRFARMRASSSRIEDSYRCTYVRWTLPWITDGLSTKFFLRRHRCTDLRRAVPENL